ncbi:MAG: hypothetical protein WBM44_21690 [Waterburya sp.]
MIKHTQAQITRTVDKNQPSAVLEKTQNQMEYYMGAKLVEIGVDPKSAIYRWSVSNQDNEKLWSLTAYWGSDKEKLLSGKMPLSGIDLIDCAKANAPSGLETTAMLCGYGSDVSGFQAAVQQACSQLGLNIKSLNDSLKSQSNRGIDFAPDNNSSL